MLTTTSLTLYHSLELGLVVAAILAVATRFGSNGRRPVRTAILAMLAALAMSFVLSYLLLGTYILVEPYHAWSSLLSALVGAATAAYFLLTRTKGLGSKSWLIFGAASMLLTLSRLTFIVGFPQSISVQTPGLISSEMAAKVGGALLGIVLPALLALLWFRMSSYFPAGRLAVLSGGLIALASLRQLIFATQMLVISRTLSLPSFLFGTVATAVNWIPRFFYLYLLATALLVALAHFSRPIDGLAPAANNAAKRKLLAALRGHRRVSVSLVAVAMAIGSLSTAASVTAESRKRLSPARVVKSVDGRVRINSAEVADGSLRRFSYSSKQGEKVRFIIIKKSSGLFGVALDACTICGSAGYYQSGTSVICAKCESVINTLSIGTSGGCNPIPIGFQKRGNFLEVKAVDLESKAGEFR